MKKYLSFLVFTFFTLQLVAQDFNIGVRAGLNYSKFQGPSEEGVNESFNISSGFHFGINFQWNFSSFFGVRGEVLYSQIGSGYTYDDEGFYIFDFVNTSATERFVVRDRSNLQLDISNAHIMFPITGHITLSDKFEIYGGAYFSTLVSPVGIGEWTFGRPGENAPDHTFRQTLDYRYNSDWAGPLGVNNRGGLILIIVNEQDVDLARLPGAYFLLEPNENGSFADFDSLRPETRRFKGIDYGFIGGLSYYINRGLYIGARLEYGMQDITNTEVDYSIKNVQDDGSLIFNDDFDRNVNIAISMGFRF